MKEPASLGAIYDGIKRINVCMENDCWGSATVLIFSGIDTVAWLTAPSGQLAPHETRLCNGATDIFAFRARSK